VFTVTLIQSRNQTRTTEHSVNTDDDVEPVDEVPEGAVLHKQNY
jgi:hypothetical protein